MPGAWQGCRETERYSYIIQHNILYTVLYPVIFISKIHFHKSNSLSRHREAQRDEEDAAHGTRQGSRAEMGPKYKTGLGGKEETHRDRSNIQRPSSKSTIQNTKLKQNVVGKPENSQFQGSEAEIRVRSKDRFTHNRWGPKCEGWKVAFWKQVSTQSGGRVIVTDLLLKGCEQVKMLYWLQADYGEHSEGRGMTVTGSPMCSWLGSWLRLWPRSFCLVTFRNWVK